MRTVLTITCQGKFSERILEVSPDSIQIQGFLFGKENHELFRTSTIPFSDYLIRNVWESFQLHSDELTAKNAESELQGCWFSASGRSTQPELVATYGEIERLSDLATSLRELDRTEGLTAASIRHWLKAARARVISGDLDEAYLCAAAALERSSLPYLTIMGKDDSSLKYRAAQATYDVGRKAEAVEMIIQLAERRLSRIQDSWRQTP